jgi:hypothetical protein
VESVLIKDSWFRLPNKRKLCESNFDVIVVDCTEGPIQRPKKATKILLREAKTATLKTLVFAEKSGKILAIAQSEGKKHDYALFMERNRRLRRDCRLLTDTGFLGVKTHFANAVHPDKSSKLHPLTKAPKENNRRISSARICVEHVNARLKAFKIPASPYLNRRKKFLPRTALIAAILNLNLGY